MRSTPLLSAVMILVAAVPLQAATILEREFRYPAEGVSVVRENGAATVTMAGAFREFVPGRPDLPVVSERVELPDGMKVSHVEAIILDMETPLEPAWIPPAPRLSPGLESTERTPPDAAIYGSRGFHPQAVATLGYQGYERGRGVAYLLIHPVRWEPASRRLQRIERIRVRLTLELDRDADVVPRERVGVTWEERGGTGDSRTAPGTAGAAETSTGARGPAPQPFRPTQLPSIMGSPVAYVIITSDAMAGEFQRLADWKTQSGVPAVVRTLSFILSQYPFGVDDADKIRQFIRDAYSRWGTQWVLLGGDTDVIPTRIAYSTLNAPIGEYSDVATDLYYSCLDGNWNADGDHLFGEGLSSSLGDKADLLPEVWVGRAPVSTLAQATQFVDKTFQYTRTPVGDYALRSLFFAEVMFPQDWNPSLQTVLDGAELAEECLPFIQTIPAQKYARLYENHLDPRWEPGSVQEFKARVIDSLNVGYNVSVHMGHGFRNVMSVGDGTISNADAMALTNGNRLTNLYAVNCTSNAIDFPSIGEAFMHAPGGGAVTCIGSTRVDYPYAGRNFQKEYFKLVFQDSVSAVGEAQARQKLDFVANSVIDNSYRWTVMTLLLLGDPELRIWTGTPRTMSVTHPASVTANVTALSVNVQVNGQPLYGARVTAYKPNDEYRIVTTDGSGNAMLDFRPDSTGSFTLTVTSYDCRPYQAVISVTPASQPLLVERTPVIDDDNLGGTNGNGNQIVEAGEVVDVRIPIRNAGTTSAPFVTGTLGTTDPAAAISGAANSYGTVGPGAVANGTGWYRFSTPYTLEDQHEIPFTLTLIDDFDRVFVETLQITVRAPEPRHFEHTVVETVGDGDGRPEPGETVQYLVRVRNLGTGVANGVTAVLRNYDGLASVTDSIATLGDIPPGAEVQGDAVGFSVANVSARLELRLSTNRGLLVAQLLDLTYPASPAGLAFKGSASSIELVWGPNQESDLRGYYVYRSGPGGGAVARVNTVPSDRTSFYRDGGLAPLTRYDHAVAAVDSSGNVSALTAPASSSTNPPYHTVFPISMGRNTPSSVAVAQIYQSGTMDILAGADVLYCWHSDGSSPVDADQSSVTSGDFTTLGRYYAAGATVADLDGGGGLEIVAPAWETNNVYVFDTQGQVKPGWPFYTGSTLGLWSLAAAGDLDNDGDREIVFGSNGLNVFALRADGTEWLDGDSNNQTQGVFKILNANYNFGTPALADLDQNGQLDIVYGGNDGVLYAWRPDGTNLPGFPIVLGGNISGSAAVGHLDGAGDSQLDIVIASGTGDDSLYVFGADGGRRAGFPVLLRCGGSSKQPSPALADMNGDGFRDIVAAGTDGKLYVYDRTGALHPGFVNARYSSLPDAATESSPVVADISGDGIPDIVMGDENGVLTGFSGTGQLLPGFPIALDGEVRGTPALCDCDGDGLSEIVVAGWDAKLHVWDYDFPFSPGATPPWPQFHHDAMRTGFASAPTWVDTPSTGGIPAAVEFSPPAPNPSRSVSRISWAVPTEQAGGSLEIAVFDLVGRRVRRLADGPAAPGRFSVEWNLRSDDGERVTPGVYFVRLALGEVLRSHRFVVLY